MPLVMLLMLAFPSCAIIEINGLGNDYKDLDESHCACFQCCLQRQCL